MANTVLAKDFDPNRVVFAAKTQTVNDTINYCKVSYNFPDSGEGRLIMQSAKMKSPFGASSMEKFGQPNKWNIQLSFTGEDRKSSIASFRNALNLLDSRIVTEGINRPDDVGGRHEFDHDDDDTYRQKTIRKGYKGRIQKGRVSDDGNAFPDTFRITIPWDNANKRPRDYVKFYDANNEETTWEVATVPGAEVVCLFDVSNIWSSLGGHTFGPTIRLSQMKVYSTPDKVSGFQIRPEEEDDDEEDDESVDVEEVEVEVEEIDYVSE